MRSAPLTSHRLPMPAPDNWAKKLLTESARSSCQTASQERQPRTGFSSPAKSTFQSRSATAMLKPIPERKDHEERMSHDTLTITDNRTGQTYEVAITDGTVRSLDLRQIKVNEEDFGLMGYDPAFTN